MILDNFSLKGKVAIVTDCVKFFPHIFLKNLIFLFFHNIPQKSAHIVINGVKPHYTPTRYRVIDFVIFPNSVNVISVQNFWFAFNPALIEFRKISAVEIKCS